MGIAGRGRSKPGTIHQWFQAAAGSYPSAVAVVDGDLQLSYSALDDWSDAFAHRLREHGLGPGRRAGLVLPRGACYVAAMLAIMKTGACYFGLDLDLPLPVLRRALATGRVWLTVTAADMGVPLLSGIPTVQCISPPDVAVNIERDRGAAVTAGDAACVFYTSGTTGPPKAVISPHGGTTRLFMTGSPIAADERTVSLWTAPPYWDAMNLEVWGTLMSGGRLVIPSQSRFTPGRLRRYVERDGVNVLWITGSLFKLFADEAVHCFQGFQTVITGGERMSPRHARRVLEAHPGLRLINGYGPVESTVFATTHQVTISDLTASDVPIGIPVPETDVRVVDEERRIVPVGRTGELAIGGYGLALAYLGDRPGTEQAFLSVPNAPQSRYYLTGDIGYLDERSILHFVGRADRQVKFHGVRVDLTNLEAVLEAHDSIARCAVLAETDDDLCVSRLIAYYTTYDGKACDQQRIQDFVAERLGPLSSPSVYILCHELPLSVTGKVDYIKLRRKSPYHLDAVDQAGRRGKAADQADHPVVGREGPAYGGEVADWIVTQVRSICGRPQMEITDSLRAAGFMSIDAIRLVARVEQHLGITVRISDVLEMDSPTKLAQFITAKGSAVPAKRGLQRPVNAAGAGVLSPGEFGFWMGEQIAPGSPAHTVALEYRITGRVDATRLAAALREVIARHDALRTCYVNTQGGLPRLEINDGSVFELPKVRVTDEHEVAAFDNGINHGNQFELAEGRLVTGAWFELPDEKSILRLQVHHIAFDGWSEGILTRELGGAYSGAKRPVLPAQYSTYRKAIRARLPQIRSAQGGFWRELVSDGGFGDLFEAAETEDARTIERSFLLARSAAGDTVRLGTAASPFSIIAYLHARTVAVLTGRKRFFVGIPFAGRTIPGFENTIGFFVNTIPIPFESSWSISAFWSAARRCLSHAEFPYREIVVLQKHATPWFPICQNLFVMQNNRVAPPDLGPETAVWRAEPPTLGLMFPLEVQAWHGGDTGWVRLRVSVAGALRDSLGPEGYLSEFARQLGQSGASHPRRGGGLGGGLR